MFMFANILFSSTHVLATYLQWIVPSVVNRFNYIVLERSVYFVNFSQQIRGKYAGITGQVGSNAFFITIFIAIVVSKLYVSKTLKSKLVLLFFLILGFYALLLTEKRGLLLFNILTIFFMFGILIYKKLKLKKIKSLIIIFITILIFIFIWLLSNNSYLLEYYLFDEDISTGRVGIYKDVMGMIGENPVLGNGIGSIEESLNIKGHNIYLQLWAESGLIALILFVILIAGVLIFSVRLFSRKNIEDKNGRNYFDKVLFSIYIQFIFILYGFTGNPLYDYFILGIYIISASVPYYVSVAISKSKKEGEII
ncbi:O-antigen ligase family protein [Exiguobacterium antarcticum]|uniref:O-antigen ligase family protein n=2 Tax=Exiguobacterium antarcticum TaxID=132920 RepID=A0ABT6R5N4_9BACL|nr:O-antigen ligase family protein [Exiguobacterium antarcticum]